MVEEEIKTKMIEIGGNIKKIRKSNGMLQSELAKNIGITPTTMSRIENGTVDIKLETIFKVSYQFNVPVVNIMYGNDYVLLNRDKLVELSEKV